MNIAPLNAHQTFFRIHPEVEMQMAERGLTFGESAVSIELSHCLTQVNASGVLRFDVEFNEQGEVVLRRLICCPVDHPDIPTLNCS